MRATSKMKTIYIKGWAIEVLPEYDNEFTREQLLALIPNQMYNSNTDWEAYRKTGNVWRKKRK